MTHEQIVNDWLRRVGAALKASAERSCPCPRCERKRMEAAVEAEAELACPPFPKRDEK